VWHWDNPRTSAPLSRVCSLASNSWHVSCPATRTRARQVLLGRAANQEQHMSSFPSHTRKPSAWLCKPTPPPVPGEPRRGRMRATARPPLRRAPTEPPNRISIIVSCLCLSPAAQMPSKKGTSWASAKICEEGMRSICVCRARRARPPQRDGGCCASTVGNGAGVKVGGWGVLGCRHPGVLCAGERAGGSGARHKHAPCRTAGP